MTAVACPLPLGCCSINPKSWVLVPLIPGTWVVVPLIPDAWVLVPLTSGTWVVAPLTSGAWVVVLLTIRTLRYLLKRKLRGENLPLRYLGSLWRTSRLGQRDQYVGSWKVFVAWPLLLKSSNWVVYRRISSEDTFRNLVVGTFA